MTTRQTTRQKRRERKCTQKRAFTSCSGNNSNINSNSSMTTRKRRCKVDTTLREDCNWADLPVVVASEYYDDDILDNELFRYSPKPLKWDESPRSSMHIVDLTNTSPSTCQLPPKLPIVVAQRKVVHFTTHPHRVHHVDYSSTASSTWYDRTEYATFKSDLKDTIRALYRVKGQLSQLDMNQHTFTGLERSLTHRQITGRKDIYQRYIQMILQLQHQAQHPLNDPTLLRHVSLIYTTSSVRRAQLRGMVDHDFLSATPE